MNKKIITATLLISDGPVEHEYFTELLGISNNELLSLLQEINSEMHNIELGFEIKIDNTINIYVTYIFFSIYIGIKI